MPRFVFITIAAFGAASSATAQGPTAAPARTGQGLGGPVIANLCLLSRDAVFANAKVALAADERLRQLNAAAKAEIDADRRPLDADIQAFQSDQAKLTPEQRATRQQALTIRLQPIQTKSQQRTKELESTRATVLKRISTEAEPVIAQLYRQRGCGLLIDRNSVLGGNMTNDITAAVVQALDAKISTITFNRDILPPVSPPVTNATPRP